MFVGVLMQVAYRRKEYRASRATLSMTCFRVHIGVATSFTLANVAPLVTAGIMHLRASFSNRNRHPATRAFWERQGESYSMATSGRLATSIM